MSRLVVIFEGEQAQMVRRLAAAHSKTPEDMVAFAVNHLDHMTNLAEGEAILIRKKPGDSQLFVEDVLGGGDGDRGAGEGVNN